MTKYAHPEVLVETDWVAEHLDDPNVKLVEIDVDTQTGPTTSGPWRRRLAGSRLQAGILPTCRNTMPWGRMLACSRRTRIL